MNRKFLIGLMVGIMVLMTSCQTIERAVDETFASHPQGLVEEEAQDKSFIEGIKDALIDESNDPVFVLDIISDAEDKMGFEFPIGLGGHFQTYLAENKIQRYLSKEEIIEILKAYDDQNLLLSSDRRDEVMEDLFKLVGKRDFYIYDAKFRIHDTSIYIYIVNPNNPNHVELYYYNSGAGGWHIIPEKLRAGVDPMERAILFSDIDFDVYKKIVDEGIEVLKEMGDYREFNTMNNDLGIDTISTHLDGGDLVFKAKVKGLREDYDLTFDADGNLMEKVRV